MLFFVFIFKFNTLIRICLLLKYFLKYSNFTCNILRNNLQILRALVVIVTKVCLKNQQGLNHCNYLPLKLSVPLIAPINELEYFEMKWLKVSYSRYFIIIIIIIPKDLYYNQNF